MLNGTVPLSEYHIHSELPISIIRLLIANDSILLVESYRKIFGISHHCKPEDSSESRSDNQSI